MDSTVIEHYGTKRHSGRYPWGSGEDPYQSDKQMVSYFNNMRKSGMSDKQIADLLSDDKTRVTVEDIRQWNSTAKYNIRVAEIAQAERLKAKRMSNVAIGQQMGKDESYVRTLLSDKAKRDTEARDALNTMLKDEVKKSRFIDVGSGTELFIGVNATRLKQALSDLEDQGYNISQFSTQQLGTGKDTRRIVLSAPEDGYKEVRIHEGEIMPVGGYLVRETGDYKVDPVPVAISQNRIKVKYAEEGGKDMDGVLELRPGVSDLDLGGNSYAQVRILTDQGNYLKGMAIYNPNLPKDVDIVFNTNKKIGTSVDDVLKKADMTDPLHPFGAQTKPNFYLDATGKQQQSALNSVNDEGDWDGWSRTLSSQFLAKQDPRVAKKQLMKREEEMLSEFDEIMSLNNSVVRETLMRDFAESADSQAVHMKAAPFANQTTSVLLPIPSLRPNEVYAPNYDNGDKVVLIRYPHAGTFEIPELVVNNKGKDGWQMIGNKRDAIGIHPKTANQLSGADFDGDTVIIIPNHDGKVRFSRPIAGLSDFDSKVYSVPVPEGKTKTGLTMNKQKRGMEMGMVSNLITDMTIKGASEAEIAKAVKHSMVVIDAYKHGLDWKQSEIDNGIKELRLKYQGKATGGASTLLSKASGRKSVDARAPITPDKETGERRWRETGSGYFKMMNGPNPRLDDNGQPMRNNKGEIIYERIPKLDRNGEKIFVKRQQKSTKMMETNDARTLSSGSEIEEIYAEHANNMKALANAARRVGYKNTPYPYDKGAETLYASEVEALNRNLIRAQKNAPMERAAQSIATSMVKAKKLENPDLDNEQIKKYKSIALDTARKKAGASKAAIYIEDREWEAIQAGAVNKTTLRKILQNADSKRVKQLATPKTTATVSAGLEMRAKSLAAAGNLTQAEIASKLGVSVSTVSKLINS